MARKNNLKKRKQYSDYLVQKEQENNKEREEKLQKLKEVQTIFLETPLNFTNTNIQSAKRKKERS